MTSARKRGALRTLLARGAALPQLPSRADAAQTGVDAAPCRRARSFRRCRAQKTPPSSPSLCYFPGKGKSEPSRRSLGSFGRLWPLTGKTAKENELWNSGR